MLQAEFSRFQAKLPKQASSGRHHRRETTRPCWLGSDSACNMMIDDEFLELLTFESIQAAN